VIYAVLSATSLALAFVLRFELSPVDRSPAVWGDWFLGSVGIVVALRVATAELLGLHRASWRYVGVRDVLPTLLAVGVGSALAAPILLVIWQGWFPRSVLVMDAMICFLLTSGARLCYRLVAEHLLEAGRGGQRVVVLGAGAAGDMVVRAMQSHGLADYTPVALLDDDPFKQGTTLRGVPVVGPIREIGRVARETGAEAVVMALPSASTSEIYKVIRHCRATSLPLKTTPDLARFLAGEYTAPPLTDFRLEDLLHRRPVPVDEPAIREYVSGRTVLVTGAAGSIGSELCRQLIEHKVRRVLCLDRDENGLFRLEHDLRQRAAAAEVVPILADVRERDVLERIFAAERPEVVFHAAAYKHVPVLQCNLVAAVRNNVQGTLNIVETADRYQVSECVLISTDKAVNPTSVMGASKRVAERIVRNGNRDSGTCFSVIRFGNVLGSNGSVVELFQKQIRAGGPVTVTHPDIERFFMTIPEAVHLVLFAATMGQGGETFILDMGKPVRIADLAHQMIRLSGLTPEVDVAVQYTGLRPGEKLYEELWTDAEQPQPTGHAAILRAPGREGLSETQELELVRLLSAARRLDEAGCWRALLRLVPSYQGTRSPLDEKAPPGPVSSCVVTENGISAPAASLDRTRVSNLPPDSRQPAWTRPAVVTGSHRPAAATVPARDSG